MSADRLIPQPAPHLVSVKLGSDLRDESSQMDLLLVDLVLPVALIERFSGTVCFSEARYRDLISEAPPRDLPGTLAFALFTSRFDPLDLLDYLVGRRYRGRVIAVTPPLPRRVFVQKELRQAAKDLRIFVFELLLRR